VFQGFFRLNSPFIRVQLDLNLLHRVIRSFLLHSCDHLETISLYYCFRVLHRLSTFVDVLPSRQLIQSPFFYNFYILTFMNIENLGGIYLGIGGWNVFLLQVVCKQRLSRNVGTFSRIVSFTEHMLLYELFFLWIPFHDDFYLISIAV